MTCNWCGDQHGADQLCQRAQLGMTRRSFCFLFGAGIVGATLGGETQVAQIARIFHVPTRLITAHEWNMEMIDNEIRLRDHVLGLKRICDFEITGYFDAPIREPEHQPR